jgi:flavorubredoxin
MKALAKKISDNVYWVGFDVKEQMECYFVPNESELDQCYEMGKRFATTLSGQ